MFIVWELRSLHKRRLTAHFPTSICYRTCARHLCTVCTCMYHHPQINCMSMLTVLYLVVINEVFNLQS